VYLCLELCSWLCVCVCVLVSGALLVVVCVCVCVLVSGALLVVVPVSSAAGAAALPPLPLPGARAALVSRGGARAPPPAVARVRSDQTHSR